MNGGNDPHISDVIARLRALQAQHGDLEVTFLWESVIAGPAHLPRDFADRMLKPYETSGFNGVCYKPAGPGELCRTILVIDPSAM